MDTGPPPPPPIPFQSTSIPQPYPTTYPPPNDAVPRHHSPTSSSSTSSIIIVMIVISSAIILSATIYLLIRFLSRRYNRSFRTPFSPADDVVQNNNNETEHVRQQTHHVISVTNNVTDSLPLFTFSSLTGKIAGGDCAVCLSKFEDPDLLRLLPLCCHAFHVECIDAWLKANQTCPLCRSSVNPSDADILNRLGSGNRSNSFRIEIGTISQRREPANADRSWSRSRRSYSVGSYDYVMEYDGYEIPVESTHRSGAGGSDKDSTVSTAPAVESLAAEVGGGGFYGGGGGGGSGRLGWLRDYVANSIRGSGRFFAGSSRRSESVNEFEGSHGRIGEEISELFRWFSGI